MYIYSMRFTVYTTFNYFKKLYSPIAYKILFKVHEHLIYD